MICILQNIMLNTLNLKVNVKMFKLCTEKKVMCYPSIVVHMFVNRVSHLDFCQVFYTLFTWLLLYLTMCVFVCMKVSASMFTIWSAVKLGVYVFWYDVRCWFYNANDLNMMCLF